MNYFSKSQGWVVSLTALLVAAAMTLPMSVIAKMCPGDNGGLTLPPGFCARVFADNIGHARHLVVDRSGVIYVNTWSGKYFSGLRQPQGGHLVALLDTKGIGKANVIKRFGDSLAHGSTGGTGIAIYGNSLYAEEKDRIVRYALREDEIVPTAPPEIVVSGLPIDGDHPQHPFVIDADGNLFVSSGSASNSCQRINRMLQSPGQKPCTELETRGGIWRFDANKTGQKFSPAQRYATGIRNAEGLAFDLKGRLYATDHGRDQLFESWPKLYQPKQGQELPAEIVVRLERGADYGWPECYYDGVQKKLVLAPEYGGDGGNKVGNCSQKQKPIASFPAHWAPNDMMFYAGTQFPARYSGGFYIVFHGSWNRAPAPQGGYNVVYQPMVNGAPSGKFIVFADGFAGRIKQPGAAKFRPSGLAIGPDGAMYISDDKHGRIWQIIYVGEDKPK